MEQHGQEPETEPMERRAKIAWIVFAAIAAFYLWAEHRAHLLGVLPFLPFLLVLACPLMHVFMHGGHGHGRGDRKHRDEEVNK